MTDREGRDPTGHDPAERGHMVRGWCPGALRPMQSGDGLVVRIRPTGGRLLPRQAAGVAALAAAHGNGLIDLTSRANMQLRGISGDSHRPLVAGLRTLGLVDTSPADEARRNIVVSPFAGDDDGTEAIGAALAAALTSGHGPDLPGKFGFAVDCGERPVLRETPADIRIERGAAGELMVYADGAATGAAATVASAATLAMALTHWFVASGGVTGGRGRMAAHLARCPIELPAVFRDVPVPVCPPGTPHARPGPHPLGRIIAFEFGQLEAHTLAALATLGPLRITPWRMLLVEGLTTAPSLPGVIDDPADPLLRIVACTGAPGCPQALAPTRPLARSLAQTVVRSVLRSLATSGSGRAPQGPLLHVSGCTKGCARAAISPLTLLAETGGFALIVNGTAATEPTRRGLDADSLLDHPQTLTELLC